MPSRDRIPTIPDLDAPDLERLDIYQCYAELERVQDLIDRVSIEIVKNEDSGMCDTDPAHREIQDALEAEKEPHRFRETEVADRIIKLDAKQRFEIDRVWFDRYETEYEPYRLPTAQRSQAEPAAPPGTRQASPAN